MNQRVQVREGELGPYDFIYGRDYLHTYGIDLLFSENMIQWDGMKMAMKELNQYENTEQMTTGSNW